MIVHFVGICMFEIGGAPRAFLPNLINGLPDHPDARPHEAFIAVPVGGAEHDGWGPPQTRAVPALNNVEFWVFPLDGVEIAFVPAPSGGLGNIDVSVLRQMRDVVPNNCPDKTVLKDLEHAASDLLAARVLIPGGPLRSINLDVPNTDQKLSKTELTVADRVTIIATKLPDANGLGGGTTRVLRILDVTEIAICNVDPVPVNTDDMADIALYCSLMDVEVAPLAAGSKGLPRKKVPRSFPITLGPGCSNTQWP